MPVRENIAGLKAVIWDIDGVFYRYTPEILEDLADAMAKAVVKLDLLQRFNHASARKVGIESYDATGSGLSHFINLYDMNRDLLHDQYHKEISLDFIKPCERLKAAFEKSRLLHAAISHSSTGFVRRVLTANEIFRRFDPDLALGIEEFGYAMKDKGPEAFLGMYELLKHRIPDLKMNEIAMVEDTAKNLVYPHPLGMHTIYIHAGIPANPTPDHIDAQFKGPTEALEFLHSCIEPGQLSAPRAPNPQI
jgi:FMN phosphatase YigB (HAD superfamily)